MAGRKKKGKLEQGFSLPIEGFPAYTIDELLKTGLYGHNREEALDIILCRFYEEHRDRFEKLGITSEDARRRGYIPSRQKR